MISNMNKYLLAYIQVGAFVCSTWCDLETFKLLLKQLNFK